MQSVKCLYFTSDKPPINRPILVINGSNSGIINNVCVPSLVNPNYAPPGRHLISVSIIKPVHETEAELINTVKNELRTWFKREWRAWDHLKTYDIKHALPRKAQISLPSKNKIKPFSPGIYVCGDHTYHGSIQGAMQGARYTANAISWDLALSGNK